MVTPLGEVVSPSVRPDGLDAHDSHASASMLGQFRTSAAASLYLRADLYLHNGVEMRPLSAAEKQKGNRGVGGAKAASGDEQALHNDNGIVTVVPPPSSDFRGILGDLERATSTYKRMENHVHNDPFLSLPLFRLMSWVDPKFIPGWTMGAAIMIRERSENATAKALNYLEAGLKDNPENIEILVQQGYTVAVCRKELSHAREYFLRARKSAFSRSKLGISEAEALREGYHWLIILDKELKLPSERKEIAEEGRHMFPDDKLFQRI